MSYQKQKNQREETKTVKNMKIRFMFDLRSNANKSRPQGEVGECTLLIRRR